jgi:hypothetical protein
MNLYLKEEACEIAIHRPSFLPALKDGASARDLQ